MRGVDIDDGRELVGLLPQLHVGRIIESGSVHVAEDHRASKSEIADRPLELVDRRGGIVQGQRRQRREMPSP
jgi:hypothetical protein